MDRLAEVIDALGNSTTYGYDDTGNRTTVTNASRQPVSTSESGADCGDGGTGDGDDDDSDTIVDDGCPSTVYTYDELNRVESVTDALGRTTNYAYDEAGNLIERTDARGLATEYDYDELNRLILVEHLDGESLVDDVDYAYDEVGNRETMVDDTGMTTYAYDALDRPTDITFPGSSVVSYEYDEVGNRVKITYPDSKDVDYTYDESHNLETVTEWLTEVTTYTYDDVGRLESTALPNGIDATYTYDDAGRLDTLVNADQTPTTISSFDYTVDAVGNRTAMEDLSGTNSYEYDALYRLTAVTYPDTSSDTYTYDSVGNRLTKDSDDYTYDAADQLADLEGVSYDYDENGNQIERDTDTFEYDHENRLVESVIDSVTSTSIYNGDGLRMSHTVGVTTTNYTWDVARSLPVVLQDGENTYVYGLDLISATDSEDDQTYFLYDGLGSVADVTDENGDVVASYSYDVFGAIRSQTGSSGYHWLFTGEQEDSETQLYYLRARYLDPQTGRFLTLDPFGGTASMPGHQNRYPYVANNPVGRIDPSGWQGVEVATGTATVSCTAGAAASAGALCVIGVAAAGGVVLYYSCYVGTACDALGGVVIDAGGTIADGAGSALGAIGGIASGALDGFGLFGGKKPAVTPVPESWGPQYWGLPPVPEVWYPSATEIFPPNWDCYEVLPAWMCKVFPPAIIGGVIGKAFCDVADCFGWGQEPISKE